MLRRNISTVVMIDLIIDEVLINGVEEEVLAQVVEVVEEVRVAGLEPVLNVEMKAICLENAQLQVILVMRDHEDALNVEKKATSLMNALMKLNLEWEEVVAAVELMSASTNRYQQLLVDATDIV